MRWENEKLNRKIKRSLLGDKDPTRDSKDDRKIKTLVKGGITMIDSDILYDPIDIGTDMTV